MNIERMDGDDAGLPHPLTVKYVFRWTITRRSLCIRSVVQYLHRPCGTHRYVANTDRTRSPASKHHFPVRSDT